MPSSIERITMALPPGFDPRKHEGALRKMITDKHGEGFEIATINTLGASHVVATRQVAITEVSQGSGSDSFDVRLVRGTKPGDGEKVAAKLADQYEGYEMTRFEPFLGKATLSVLSEEETRCRGAAAVALGVKPWEVQVKATADGGFELELPRTYVPSKHDDKLTEVAEHVVGTEGWYLSTNPAKLLARIIPSAPPTFPATVAYPFDTPVPRFRLDSPDWAKIPLGMTLPAPGSTVGPPFTLDLLAGAHLQCGGVSGGGKALGLATRVPVPASARFPAGWAVVEDLRRGDEVLDSHGRPTEVLGTSEVQDWSTFRVHFDDGQHVDVSATHEWLASTSISRSAYSASRVAARGRKYEDDMASVVLIRAALAQARPGEVASLPTISRLAGLHPATATHLGVPDTMAHDGFVSTGKPAQEYDVLALNDHVREHGALRLSGASFDQTIIGLREWASARELADVVADDLFGRPATRSERAGVRLSLERGSIPSRPGSQSATRTTVYAIDEVLDWLANRYEQTAGLADSRRPVQPLETIVDTKTMLGSLRAASTASNWAVRLPQVADSEHVSLPVDPYLLGAWLGDGTSRNGGITVGASNLEFMSAELGAVWPITRLEQRAETTASILHFGRRNLDECVRGHEDWVEAAPSRLCRSCRSASGRLEPRINQSLHDTLVALGVSCNKHIPVGYLRASASQRLALLQGLMDTDGHVATDGGCELALSDERLAADALELIRSLGIKATMTSGPAGYRDASGERITTKDRHRIKFTTTERVVRMPRKVARLPETVRTTQQWLYVTDIEVLDAQPMRCVKVADPHHLLLVEGFIPTHNSVLINDYIAGTLARGAELVIVDLPSKSVDFLWCKPFCRPGGWGCASLASSVTALGLVMEEGERRAKVLAEYDVVKWTDLPPSLSQQFRPIVVVVDELTGLFFPEKVPKLPKDHELVIEANEINLQKAMLEKNIKRIAAELRFVGVCLLVASQVASVATGIDPAMRTNLHHKVLMGSKPTDNNRRLVLSDPQRVPKVPGNVSSDPAASRGTGSAEPEGSEPAVFKSYFASTADLREWLVGQGVQTTPAPEPTSSQVARLTPTLKDDTRDDRSGGRSDSERAPSGRSAAAVRREMGDEWDVDPATGQRLNGFERANAARHAAKVGEQQQTQRAEEQA